MEDVAYINYAFNVAASEGRRRARDKARRARGDARAVLGETLRGRKPGPHRDKPAPELDPEIEYGTGDDDVAETEDELQ